MSDKSSARTRPYLETTGTESPAGDYCLADDFVRHEASSDNVIFAGRKWSVVESQITMPGLPSPHKAVFERHPGAVCVLAFNPAGEVLLVNQYRHPVRSVCWEVPAGLLDVPGEPSVVAAQREFAEEALAQARHWGMLTEWVASPTLVAEPLRAFAALDVESAPRPDGFVVHGEEQEMTRSWVPFDEVLAAVVHSRVANPGLMISVLSAARKIRATAGALHNPELAWPTHPRYRDMPDPESATAESQLPMSLLGSVTSLTDSGRRTGESKLADVYDPADVVSRETICTPADFDVVRETFVMKKAGEVTREVICAGERLALLVENDAGEVFLQRRYIPALEHYMWQLPSIRCSAASEDLSDCEPRPTAESVDVAQLDYVTSLVEGVGINPRQVSFLGRWFETPGGFDQHTRCVRVRVDHMPENVTGQWFAREDILRAIDAGNVHDFGVVVANLLVEYHSA